MSSKEELVQYSLSSYKSYVENYDDPLVENQFVMKMFGEDKRKYHSFVMQNADYQEKLEYLKHTYEK